MKNLIDQIVPAFIPLIILCGCNQSQKEDKNSEIKPEGVFVQILRIDTQDKSESFDSLMLQLVEVADSANLKNPHYWLCYREAPNFYWLLTGMNYSIDDFIYPDTFEGFVSTLMEYAVPTKRKEIMALAEPLKNLPTTKTITQQYAKWSTTNNVEARDFPKSKLVIYKLKESEINNFSNSMNELVDFLSANNISTPVEGFLVHPRSQNVAWQVIFLPREMPFDDAHKFNELSDNLKIELAEIQGKVNATATNIQFSEVQTPQGLSYGTY